MSDGTLTFRRQLSRLAGQHFGGERDLYDVLGYPRSLNPEEYAEVYLRQDIAGRIVDAFPSATWRESPTIKANDEFVEAFWALEERHHIMSTLARADKLSGMGHYGVVVLGLDGRENMALPAMKNNYQLLYVQPHGERTADISKWNDDTSSPRFGKPELYRVTTGVNWTGTGAGNKVFTVHHSRAIHFAEGALEDESIGIPRLQRIWNRLMDLDKIIGSSAEVFWQNASMIYAFLADKDAEFDPEDKKEMASQIEQMQHGLRRFLRLRGVTPQQMAAAVPDSRMYVESTLDVIAGAVGIPKRILMGTERGELSSAQDENNWASRIAERREQFVSPMMLRPLIDKMIRLGVLPRPKDGYEIEWPKADTLGEEGRARIADIKATALQKYASSPGADFYVSPETFIEWLGIDPDTVPPLDLPGPDLPAEELAAPEVPAEKIDIAALGEIVRSVADGSIPPETGIHLIVMGFPQIDETRARKIIEPLAGFTPTAKQPTDNEVRVQSALDKLVGGL